MFHEEWYPETQCKLLNSKACEVKDLEGIAIEIGCWEGRSTIAIANAIFPENLRAVDTWQGNFDENPDNISVKLAQERDIFDEFKKNIKELTKENVLFYKMDCFVYLANLQEKIKFCHIDACHDYTSVKQTLRMVLPKLVPGGIVCGDDFATAHAGREDLQGGVEKAVSEMCPGFQVIENFWFFKKNNPQNAHINFINNCINLVMLNKTKLNAKAINFDGMSSFKIRNFLNHLLEYPESKYLEIGVWKGSTFYSALYKNNPVYAVAIDNWSEFQGSSSQELFKQNIQDLECSYEIFCCDSFIVDKKKLKQKFNIYFYDGEHSVLSHELALTYYYDCLDDYFIYICDDWNAPAVKEGTLKGIEKTGLKIIREWEFYARYNGDVDNWWNGLYVALISKI